MSIYCHKKYCIVVILVKRPQNVFNFLLNPVFGGHKAYCNITKIQKDLTKWTRFIGKRRVYLRYFGFFTFFVVICCNNLYQCAPVEIFLKAARIREILWIAPWQLANMPVFRLVYYKLLGPCKAKIRLLSLSFCCLFVTASIYMVSGARSNMGGGGWG